MSVEPTNLTFMVDGRRLHVACWGEPTAPAVMLIHGLRDHCRNWDALASVLSAGFRVIAPDLRGHGDSDWASADGYALSSYVADLADVAEALDLQHYAIVGHSLGGALGLRVASAYPDRVTAFAGIECIELPIHRDEIAEPKSYSIRLRQWIERRRTVPLREARYYPSADDCRDRMQKEQPSLARETVTHLASHAIACESGKGWRWKFDPRVRYRAPEDQRGSDLDDILDGVSCPVLLFYGDRSWIPVLPAHRLGRLKNYSVSHVEGGSHWLHHEFPERFASEVLTFLHQNCRTRPDA